MAFRILAATVLMATCLCPDLARADEDGTTPLRYSLVPGREFSYHNEAVSKQKGGAVYVVDWKIWAIDRVPDGSWRLVLRCDLSTKRATDAGSPRNDPADTLIWRCRMFDDGRLIGAPVRGTVRDPYRLFPRLPAGPRERESGWESAGLEQQSVILRHRLTPGTRAGGDVVSISTKSEGPEDKVWLESHSTRATFDAKRGAVTRLETEDASEHLAPGVVTRGVIELVSIDDRGEEWAKGFGEEADRYFDAIDAYEEAVKRARRDAAHCKELLADAKAKLEAVRDTVTTPVFLDSLNKWIASHDRSSQHDSEQASERAGRLGKPAAGWEARDIVGKPHRLEDYRGKVVVMDFWYRNCGWCIHAMPQIVKLADTFRDRGVVVLGMCTDEKDEDARAVIDAMGLNYPTIKAAGIPEKYGVQAFPTLIVVDPAGVVREFHVGYSPRLHEELSELIRTLLAESRPRNP